MLNQLIDHYTGGNKAKFAELLGVRAQTINSWEKRESFDHELLYSTFDDLSGDWLLSGEGEMLKSKHSAYNTKDGNKELIELCKQLVANYQQREDVMSKLVSMLK